MTSPKLRDDEIAWIIQQVAEYIGQQRQTYRGRAVPLNVAEMATMQGNLSLGGEKADEHPCAVDDLCHKHSAHLRAAQKACQKQSHDRAFLQEFVNFVRREDANAAAPDASA